MLCLTLGMLTCQYCCSLYAAVQGRPSAATLIAKWRVIIVLIIAIISRLPMLQVQVNIGKCRCASMLDTCCPLQLAKIVEGSVHSFVALLPVGAEALFRPRTRLQ